MAFSIKDETSDRLARELSSLTGETLTTAVRVSLEERLRRTKARVGASSESGAVELAALIARGRERPAVDGRTEERILGYDQTTGLPE